MPRPSHVRIRRSWALVSIACLGAAGVSMGILSWLWADAMIHRQGHLAAEVDALGEGWLESALFAIASFGAMAMALYAAFLVRNPAPAGSPTMHAAAPTARDARVAAVARLARRALDVRQAPAPASGGGRAYRIVPPSQRR